MKSRDARTLEERLRAALTLDAPGDADRVDMSATAITQRVRDACELSTLCLALAAAGDRARSS